MKQHSHRPSKWLQATQPKAASVKEATTKIEAKQKELEESQAMVDNLPAPSYQFYSRREIPGSEGYVAYESNINIIHDVSNIFPVALYFMAALVTFVTMGRFVEEERGKLVSSTP